MHVIQITIERIPDPDPDASYLEQDEFADRLAEYHNGGFGYIGIRAVATVNIGNTIQTIASPGLWGIEDDSGEKYFAEIEREQRNELDAILREMGNEAEAVNVAAGTYDDVDDVLDLQLADAKGRPDQAHPSEPMKPGALPLRPTNGGIMDITQAPEFEQDISTLYRSNDGRVRIVDDRVQNADDTWGTWYVIVVNNKPVFRTGYRPLADAYIAGYDMGHGAGFESGSTDGL